MKYKVDWDKIKSFNTKDSYYNKTWLKDYYNDGCKKTGIKSWIDLYKVLNVDFEKINPRDPNDSTKIRRLRPEEIRMNPKTREKIEEFITNQFHPTKYKGRRPSLIGLEALKNSPYGDEEIEEDVLVIKINPKIEWDKNLDYIMKNSL